MKIFKILATLLFVYLVLGWMGTLLDLQEASVVAASLDEWADAADVAVKAAEAYNDVIRDVIKEKPAAAIGPRPNIPFYTFLEIEALEASTWYSLVDLDDRTNFPHFNTNSAVLKQIRYSGVLSAATNWNVNFGVVIPIGDGGCLIDWIHSFHRVRSTQFETEWDLPEHGLSLLVNTTGDELWFAATKEYTVTAAITTTTALESPVTESNVITTYAGIGDIIMYVEEVESGGYFEHLSVGTAYNTE